MSPKLKIASVKEYFLFKLVSSPALHKEAWELHSAPINEKIKKLHNKDIHQHQTLLILNDAKKNDLVPASRFYSDSSNKSLLLLLLAFFFLFLAWFGVPRFLLLYTAKQISILPSANPDLYNAWIHPPFPIYFKVYLFNITNPDELRKGSRPKLQELGPYVFRENRTKIEIKHDDGSDTVSYKDYVSFHFDQNLSGNLRLEDEVTLVNVPFVTGAIKISELPWPLDDLAQTVLLSYKEPLFIKITVEQALFKGWRVPFLDKIEEDVGISLIPNNTFGLFFGQNDTAQGPYTVSRGYRDTSTLGIIQTFKNNSRIDYWGDSTSHCNRIRGTDGTIFPPFMNKSTVLRLFNPDLCGSLYLTFNKEMEFDGMKAYRFTVPVSMLEDSRESDENRCYCLSIEHDPDKCFKRGALDLGPCREGAPIAISTPHFLDGHPEYREKSGLMAERDWHATYIVTEPLTGVILTASKKVQINLMLNRVEGLSSLSKVPEMLLPLVWADECASVDKETSAKIKSILSQLDLVQFVAKLIAVCIFVVCSTAHLVRKMQDAWK